MTVYVVRGGGDPSEEFAEAVERALVAHTLGKSPPRNPCIQDAQFIAGRVRIEARDIIISPSLSRSPVDKGQDVAAHARSRVIFPGLIDGRKREPHPPRYAKDLGLAVGPVEKLSGHREVCKRRGIGKVSSHCW